MKYTYIYLLIIFIIIGAWLRFDRVGERSLWYDEIAGLENIDFIKYDGQLLSPEITNLDGRIITKGYYLLLGILNQFGYNEFTTRLPAVIFGILAIPLIYVLGSVIFEKKTGILSSFLLALSSFHIAYSQEARPYSMFVFFSILTYLCIYKALKQNSVIWLSCFILFTLINIYTHYAGFYVLGSQIVFMCLWVFVNFKKSWKTYLRISIILFMPFLLFLYVLKPVILKGINSIADPKFQQREIFELTLNLNFFYKMFAYFSSYGMTYGYGNWLYAIYVFFFLLGILGSMRTFRWEVVYILVSMIIPFIMLFTMFKPFTFFNNRYFIFLLPIFLIVISRGIVVLSNIFNLFLKKININYFLFSMALLIAIIHIPTLITYHYSEKDNWNAICAHLKKHVTNGDQILYGAINYSCLRYYFSDKTNLMDCITENLDENNENNIWYIKCFSYGFPNLFDKMRVLDMKLFDNYTAVLKLKRKDLVNERDIKNINFRIEVENELSKIGRWIVDKDASGNKARFAKKGEEGWLVFGPHIVLPEGKYKVRFRVKISNNSIKDEVAKINVYKGGDALKTPYANLKGTDFQKADQYRDFYLEFDQADGDRQEFRVYSQGKTDLWVDYVDVQIINP